MRIASTSPNEAFDIVISTMVFEHLPNVPKVTCEIARVLKRTGVAYIEVHLFTSLSGGHLSNYQKYPPYAHLRGLCPCPDHINKLRMQDYLDIFDRWFYAEQIEKIREPVNLLDPEIRRELRDYSEEELLTKILVMVGRKRQQGSSES